MNLTREQWREVLDDCECAPATIVRVLRGDPVAGVTARRIYKAAVKAGCPLAPDSIVVTGEEQDAAGAA